MSDKDPAEAAYERDLHDHTPQRVNKLPSEMAKRLFHDGVAWAWANPEPKLCRICGGDDAKGRAAEPKPATDAVTILKKRYGVTEERLNEARKDLATDLDAEALANEAALKHVSDLQQNPVATERLIEWAKSDYRLGFLEGRASVDVSELVKALEDDTRGITMLQNTLGPSEQLQQIIDNNLAVLARFRGKS